MDPPCRVTLDYRDSLSWLSISDSNLLTSGVIVFVCLPGGSGM